MRAARILLLGAALLSWAGCGRGVGPNPTATLLQVTTRTTERYHALAEHPFDALLGHDGYVVALEKIPRSIAHPASSKAEAPHPYEALLDVEGYSRGVAAGNPELARRLAARLDDRKIMVVTHVLAYEREGVGVRFLYNVYDHGGRRRDACDGRAVTADDPDPAFDRPTDAATRSELVGRPLPGPPACGAYADFFTPGLQALTATLKDEVAARLGKGTPAGPYTHLVIGSMGWDNDQVESVRRYGATLSNVAEAARREGGAFRPLFIGITWPSVWGWASWFDLGQLAYKLIGYGNKADDADEVGYTIVNYLVNGLARSLDGPSRIPIVAFGHSFGGRAVSRGLFSDALLRPAFKGPARAPVRLFVGLQPAFSINRFIRACQDRPEGHCGNEGTPYEDFKAGPGIVITTSEHDTANPLAWFLTRARHAGGRLGLDRAREHPAIFEILDHEKEAQRLSDAATCGRLRSRERVVMVDARSFVFDHNDVLDLEAGELMWSAIRCFVGPP